MLQPSHQLSAVVTEVSGFQMSSVRGKLPSQEPFLMYSVLLQPQVPEGPLSSQLSC